ncbi:MAG: hypothetical protein MI723_11645 [Caulobacterales bacterium]|nr:hypothetical protein [Caulobacterales bacterium]
MMVKTIGAGLARAVFFIAALAQVSSANDSEELQPGDIVPGTHNTLASFAEEVAQDRERARDWTHCPDWNAVRAETNAASDQSILERAVDTTDAAADLGDVDAVLCLAEFWRGLVGDPALHGTVSQDLGWQDLFRSLYYAAQLGADVDGDELATIAQEIEPVDFAMWRDLVRWHVLGLEAVYEYERQWGVLPIQ